MKRGTMVARGCNPRHVGIVRAICWTSGRVLVRWQNRWLENLAIEELCECAFEPSLLNECENLKRRMQ